MFEVEFKSFDTRFKSFIKCRFLGVGLDSPGFPWISQKSLEFLGVNFLYILPVVSSS